jgi:predicted RNA-binding Zn-ribbon protein involved in translation (DUF1610 family)
MPIIGGKEVTPEEALSVHCCPECGADFRTTNPAAHRNTHWRAPVPGEQNHDETRKRIKLYGDYLKSLGEDAVKVHADQTAKPADPAAHQSQHVSEGTKGENQ